MVRDLKGKHPKYFEGVLQLRDITQEVLTFVEDRLQKDNIPVAKVVELKNGFDYFLPDNQWTRALGKQLQQRFGGQVQATASLHTKKDSKELYRATILFRGLPFKKGDSVTYQGEEYKVRSLNQDIFLQHEKNGKKVHVKYKDQKQVKNA